MSENKAMRAKQYKEVKQLNLPAIDQKISAFWEENNIFEKSISHREGNETFVFYEGPPSANGLPGIHHVLARTIKDIFPRFKTMKGFQVKRKAGWDTHGLPVELGVEKELGITKEDIGKTISVEDYNEACKKAVTKYTDVWNNLTKQMGYWVDMDDPYITFQPKYMESVWWLLKEIYQKGLMYKGYTIQPYSPKAGTGLSSHELNQPGTYQEVSDTTVVAQFKAIDQNLPDELKSDRDIYFLAWTTTPWTLPSNTALTVGPKIDYVLVDTYNQYTHQPIQVVLAKSLVGKQFSGNYKEVNSVEELNEYEKNQKEIPYLILKELKGKDLEGIRYEQLFTYAQPYENPGNAFRVILGDFVTTEDGTGIVHTAPTFGADDAKVAKEAVPEVPPMLVKDENDKLVPLVDLQGRFRPEMGEHAGKYVKNEYYEEAKAPEKSVDVELAIQLKVANRAFRVEKYLHTYPNCWRTDKPILYYPLDSWFIKVTDVKDQLFHSNLKINWKPKSTGEGRFGNWLANANDWNLSRSRYWGIPLPIWRTEDGKEELCIGSVAELKAEIAKAIDAGLMEEDVYSDFEIGNMSEENYSTIDLHKNIVDDIILVSESGKPMHREADLIDVWFDSGSMPFAQWHYPFENEELIDEGIAFPADFIAEGVDQTRGWFYTLHAISNIVFDSIAYKNVVSNGLVLDKNGQKMSKRLGNAADPFETISKYGADATRWYMISNANPWDNLKFDIEGIVETQRKLFGTLFNTYSFFALYANIDGFTYKEEEIEIANRPEIDRWILSMLNTLVKDVSSYYEDYEPTKAARAIQGFVIDHLSNWYVRLCRRRFWKGEYTENKISAYQTLYTCLQTISQLMAPIAPFFSEFLFTELNKVSELQKVDSVHLSLFPEVNKELIDKQLEERMLLAQDISSLVLSLRKREEINVRQPLSRVLIPIDSKAQQNQIERVEDLILSEVNVKKIEYVTDTSGIVKKSIKPDFAVLGKKLGGKVKDVAKALAQFSQENIKEIEQKGSYDLELDDEIIKLNRDEVDISTSDLEGWLVANTENVTVALDVTIDENLRMEGYAREFVNRIQNLRKESDFEVTDRINVTINGAEELLKAVEKNKKFIKEEVLAESITTGGDAGGEEVEISNLEALIDVQKHS